MKTSVGQVCYFDSSALVKRYFTEIGSVWVQTRCGDSKNLIVIAEITRVEMAAAFARKVRGKFITQAEYHQAQTQIISHIQNQYRLVAITSQRIDTAVDLTSQHKLRGYDAVQLACALYFNQLLVSKVLSPLIFISADNELLIAAQAEGLQTENPNNYP
ncbi:type II toxin-antitoxin system VapC family toxin [Anaerolineales bacterium HSG24]|nr:type II toxin-antitoxin system VapC family toxin [Anaerolineales bacterium HSG24]